MSAERLRERTRRGSILVFVLALIVLLSVLSLRLLDETVREMRHVSQFHRRDDLRLQAYSALEVALGALSEWQQIEGQLYAPSQGWGDLIGYAEVSPSEENIRWEVKVEDETGKMPIQILKPNDWFTFFGSMHDAEGEIIDETEGRQYAESFFDWQDPDDEKLLDGAESDDYYEDLAPAYFAANLPVECFEEFRLIKGFSPDPDDTDEGGLFFDVLGNETGNFRSFRSSVSFYNNYPVNINTMSPFLRAWLCGDDQSGFEDMNRWLSGEDIAEEGEGEGRYFRSPHDPRAAPMKGNRQLDMGAECRVLRLKVIASKGTANFRLEVVVESAKGPRRATVPKPGGSSKRPSGPLDPRFSKLRYPFRILALIENENLVD